MILIRSLQKPFGAWTLPVDDGNRSGKFLGDAGNHFAEASLAVARIGYADNKQAVALARLGLDFVRSNRALLHRRDVNTALFLLIRMRIERRDALGRRFHVASRVCRLLLCAGGRWGTATIVFARRLFVGIAFSEFQHRRRLPA